MKKHEYPKRIAVGLFQTKTGFYFGRYCQTQSALFETMAEAIAWRAERLAGGKYGDEMLSNYVMPSIASVIMCKACCSVAKIAYTDGTVWQIGCSCGAYREGSIESFKLQSKHDPRPRMRNS